MFKPDTKSKYTTEGGVISEIRAESITQTGNVLVITAHKRCKPSLGKGYGITHKTTGGSLTGPRLTSDIKTLKKKARAFWRQLSSKQKAIWKNSIDPELLRANTPKEAIQELQ